MCQSAITTAWQLFSEVLVLKCISYDETRNVRIDTLICTVDGIHKRKNYE